MLTHAHTCKQINDTGYVQVTRANFTAMQLLKTKQRASDMSTDFSPRESSSSEYGTYIYSPVAGGPPGRSHNHNRTFSGISLSSVASFAAESVKDLQEESMVAKVKKLDFYGAPKAEFRRGKFNSYACTLFQHSSSASAVVALEDIGAIALTQQCTDRGDV
jgi:hypothetical protein